MEEDKFWQNAAIKVCFAVYSRHVEITLCGQKMADVVINK
jgi:hypothetical protein